MLLRGFVLAARLDVGDLGIVHQFTGERAFLEQLLAAFENFLGGVDGFFVGLRVGLRFDHLLGNGGGGGAAVVGFGLVELAFAFLRGGGQIAIFEQGEELAFAHVVAAIDVEGLTGALILGTTEAWLRG